jgi:DNA-directed RNA polymerase specialized sigma24 family protein
LALDTIDLAPADVRLIAHLASRSIRETLACLNEVKAALAEKGSIARDKRDRLHRVAYWIHTYKRQMTILEKQRHYSRLHGETQTESVLAQEQAELERKLAWRYRQQARLQVEVQKDARPSYRDIAKILNRPLGSIRSMIARARQELGQQLARMP